MSEEGGFDFLGLGSLFGGLAGTATSAAVNLKIARENREFQERMFRNRHTYMAEDLQRAGLNRVLALGGAGAAPGGTALPINLETGKPFAQAAEIRERRSRQSLQAAQVEQASSAADLNRARAQYERAGVAERAMNVHLANVRAGREMSLTRLSDAELAKGRVEENMYNELGRALGYAKAAGIMAGGAASLFVLGRIGFIRRFGIAAWRALPKTAKLLFGAGAGAAATSGGHNPVYEDTGANIRWEPRSRGPAAPGNPFWD